VGSTPGWSRARSPRWRRLARSPRYSTAKSNTSFKFTWPRVAAAKPYSPGFRGSAGLIWTTLYAHNSALKVKAGQSVRADQVVALLGATGRATGPHLQFEIRENERAVNPRPYLPKSRF
jgi:hypothetical protein